MPDSEEKRMTIRVDRRRPARWAVAAPVVAEHSRAQQPGDAPREGTPRQQLGSDLSVLTPSLTFSFEKLLLHDPRTQTRRRTYLASGNMFLK